MADKDVTYFIAGATFAVTLAKVLIAVLKDKRK